MAATGGHGHARRAFASPETAGAAGADAIVQLLVRALRLERAVLYVADDDARLLPAVCHGCTTDEPVAAGDAPPGSWSCVLPVHASDGTAALLAVARPGGRPLAAHDRALLLQVVDGAGDVLARRDTGWRVDDLDERLARADRLSALGTVAAGIAHEIRNPLVSVRTFVELVPERLHDDEFLTGFRTLALTEVDRICELAADLLALSRPTPAPHDPVDVRRIVEQTVRLVDAEARKHGVALRVRDTTLPCVVIGDEARLKQVVLNVVLNAVQATSERGSVDVAMRVEDGDARWAVIEVADTGPGIPPDALARIFEPFWTTKAGGSGLGLFVANRIVGDHGGTIRFTPRAERGTCCAIRLPAEPA